MLKVTSATLCLIAWWSHASAWQRWTFLGSISSSGPRQLWPTVRTGPVATATAPPGRQECLAGVQKQRRLCPDTRGSLHFQQKTQPRGHQTKSPDAIQTLMGRPAGPLRQRRGRFYWTLLLDDVSKFAKALKWSEGRTIECIDRLPVATALRPILTPNGGKGPASIDAAPRTDPAGLDPVSMPELEP